MRKKISIIIPVYNTEKYIEKCVLSALHQTYSNLEIICIDDGSTDRSGDILDELAKNDNRMIVIHQKNMGESGARNTGLKIASGDYIGFMDCDDWIESTMYEELANALENVNADMAIASWYCDDENGSKAIVNKKNVEKSVFNRNQLMYYVYQRDSYRAFAYMWDKLYKKTLFYDSNKNLILFDENLQLGGDVLYLAKLVLNTERAIYVNKAFYHYIQRKDSGCHTKKIERLDDWIKAYQYIIHMFENEKIKKEIIDYVKRFMAYHSSNFAQIAYEQKNREALKRFQLYMVQYKQEYINLNKEFPDRIDRYNKILNYII